MSNSALKFLKHGKYLRVDGSIWKSFRLFYLFGRYSQICFIQRYKAKCAQKDQKVGCNSEILWAQAHPIGIECSPSLGLELCRLTLTEFLPTTSEIQLSHRISYLFIALSIVWKILTAVALIFFIKKLNRYSVKVYV